MYQCGPGALRDGTKNGCVGDYVWCNKTWKGLAYTVSEDRDLSIRQDRGAFKLLLGDQVTGWYCTGLPPMQPSFVGDLIPGW